MPEAPDSNIVKKDVKPSLKDRYIKKPFTHFINNQTPREVLEEVSSPQIDTDQSTKNPFKEFHDTDIKDADSNNESKAGAKEGFLRFSQQIQQKSERMRAVFDRVQELNEVKPDGNISLSPEQVMQSVDDWKEKPFETPLENLSQSVQVLQNLKASTRAGWEVISRLMDEKYKLDDEQRSIELEMLKLKSGIGGKAAGLFKRRGLEKRKAAIHDRADEIAKLGEEERKVRYDLDTKKYTADGLQKKYVNEEAVGTILSLSQDARTYLDTLLQDEKFLDSIRLAAGADTKEYDVDEVIAGFIAYGVSQKIKTEIFDHITTERNSWDMGQLISDSIRDRIPDYKEDQYGFYKKLDGLFRYGNPDLPFPKMDLAIWKSIYANPQAREVFGDLLDKADDDFFHIAFREANQSSDHYGDGVSSLRHFPRPESFRLALQFATLQDARGYAYHSEKATYLLRDLGTNVDLMKSLEENNPELKGVGDFLEQWDKGAGYKSYNEKMRALRKFGDPYLVSEYRKNPNTFIIHSMGEGGLAQVAFDKGILSKEEAQGIEYAVFVDQSEDQALPQEIRSLLFPILSEEDGSLLPQDAVTLKKRAEALVKFRDRCGWAKDEKYVQVVDYVFNNREMFLGGSEDISFINAVVSVSGPRSKELLAGYKECLDGNILNPSERGVFLDLVKQFKIASPDVVKLYKQAREGGYEKVFISELRSIAERMTGVEPLTDLDRQKPYYESLIRHVYPDNAGIWTTYESNESCGDRSSDLGEYKIKKRYEIDLLGQAIISVKEGETVNQTVLQELQKPVYAFQEKLSAADGDIDVLKSQLAAEVDIYMQTIVGSGAMNGIDTASISTEQKLFLIISESIYGNSGIKIEALKDLMVTYEFTHFEDVAGFINGTRDRVSRAANIDYALLCELSQFYKDKIKDVNKKLIESAYENPQITEHMRKYFDELARSAQESGRQEQVNKLQVNKLGMSPGFISQMGKILEVRYKRKLAPTEVEKIVSRYEAVTGGLAEDSSQSESKNTRAAYGMLRTQRQRTFDAMKLIAGTDIDPRTVHLGEINLEEALKTEALISEGKYDPEQFAAYTAQRFIDIFEKEKEEVDLNLSKFESESGSTHETLNAYITKTYESANGRMVGGVCVSGDNPDQGVQNMWDMENYLQLVFQDPDTLQSQGLVLMHDFTQDGKRILTASFNPSSTYLYSVDEEALFKGITGTLERFGADNNFDIIALSKNKAIRTNRTGGAFEQAMDARISEVGEEYSFHDEQVFSYRPNYNLKDLDVIWKNPAQL